MNEIKPKLLRLTNLVPHYGIPINNLLCDYFDVTIAHYGKKIEDKSVRFKQIILTPQNRGPFIYFKDDIYKLCQQYDCVIALADLHLLPYVTLGLRRKRTFSLTYYGIGVSASYNKVFDGDKKFDKIRFWLMNKAESNVFYSEYPVKRYTDAGLDKNSLFVAHNTISILDKIYIPSSKKHFLFVGTLYKAKKIYDLLAAYQLFIKKGEGKPYPLIIIGDGDERENIIKWIDKNGYGEQIVLKGAIYDQEILKTYYQYAVASISPGQAGLSVLNSLAYGVPYITSANAITGGEIFNIKNDFNGFLYSGEVLELANIMTKIASDDEKVYQLSKNAQNFYFENRTVEQMVGGLVDSIKYALDKRR